MMRTMPVQTLAYLIDQRGPNSRQDFTQDGMWDQETYKACKPNLAAADQLLRRWFNRQQ